MNQSWNGNQNWNGTSTAVNAPQNSVMTFNPGISQRSTARNHGQHFSTNTIGTTQANMINFPTAMPVNHSDAMNYQLQGGKGVLMGPASTSQNFVPSQPQAFVTTTPIVHQGFSGNG